MELAYPRPTEDPHWLGGHLAMFNQSPIDVVELLEKQRAEFEAAWKRLLQRYPRKGNKIQLQIERAAAGARQREEARSEATRVIWVMREFALQVSELCKFEDKEDVFFLSLDEMVQVLSGDQTGLNSFPLDGISMHATAHCPPILRSSSVVSILLHGQQTRTGAVISSTRVPSVSHPSTAIIGFAGAVGVVEGICYVAVDRPEAGDQLQPGEILVTTTTNIGWTPLFPRAAAVVTDVGAPLSHAAIVARELGIPAVVGCGNATLELHTGDRVRVNGGQGTVEILERVNR